MTSGDAPWSVQLSPTAVRALDRLPHKVAAAIAEFVTATLPTDPYRLSKPLLGKVPLLAELREGSDTGTPIVVSSPESEAAIAFDEIARAIVEDLAPTKRFHPELKIT